MKLKYEGIKKYQNFQDIVGISGQFRSSSLNSVESSYLTVKISEMHFVVYRVF